ncbi:MAG TPA: UvrD-helicase domain-containing protein, partial [Pseudomonadota bacterium]|nr:UvrD-helicase domain-containing protein [Pseudomonadota bacterium]
MSERFLLRRDRVVQAGAGTGKTHALLTQYLHLCAGLSAHGAPLAPRAICALTFTDKAAGEMRERLQRRTTAIVRATADAASPAALPAALLQLQEVDLVQTAAALDRPLPGLAEWEQILAQLPGAPIGTFHSFAASLLRRYAALAGLDPDFTLLDEDSARALPVESSERVVLGALEGRLPPAAGAPDGSAQPTAEQAALVVSEYGFSGGPSAEGGTVEALGHLHRLRGEEGKDAAGLADSYRPAVLEAELGRRRGAVLAGLAELARLAEQLGPGSAERVLELVGLRDALAASLQRPEEAALAAALPLGELVLQGIKKLRAKKDGGAQDELAQLKERLKTAVEEITALHKSLRAAPLALALEGLLAPVSRAYDEAKRAASALDFTDLLQKARDLLRDHPAVRAEAQARFAVLLVDEFQDTNPLQAELLELLAGPLTGGAPREPGRLYIVGDRKQSIYEFRGADVAAYTTLCDRLLAGGADEETLSRSYRSRPALLHFVSALFASVMSGEPPAGPASGTGQPAPPFFVRWDAQRDPLQAVRPADPAMPGPAVELVRGAVPAA